MDTTIPALKITVKGEAVNWLNKQPTAIRQHVINVIREKASHTSTQMVVLGLTFDCPDHIYRAMKTYVYRPGIRVIFHCTSNPRGIVVTRIAWRCDDPYQDGK